MEEKKELDMVFRCSDCLDILDVHEDENGNIVVSPCCSCLSWSEDEGYEAGYNDGYEDALEN